MWPVIFLKTAARLVQRPSVRKSAKGTKVFALAGKVNAAAAW